MEACELEDKVAKVPMKKTKHYETPEEFESALKADENLEKASKALTRGRQCG